MNTFPRDNPNLGFSCCSSRALIASAWPHCDSHLPWCISRMTSICLGVVVNCPTQRRPALSRSEHRGTVWLRSASPNRTIPHTQHSQSSASRTLLLHAVMTLGRLTTMMRCISGVGPPWGSFSPPCTERSYARSHKLPKNSVVYAFIFEVS